MVVTDTLVFLLSHFDYTLAQQYIHNVQQSSNTLWHSNTFTMYFFTRTHYTNRLKSRRPSMPRTLLGGVPK
jgi:hypothetical protein